MGLVINPTAFRIGHVKAWADAWYLHRMHYPVFVHKSLEIKTLLQYILLHKYPSQWSHWIYSHATYYFHDNKFHVSLFVYDGNDPHNYVTSAKDHKYGWFKKSRFKRYWTKKQLLDLEFLYQRWYLLCQVMNLDFEELILDRLQWRVKKRDLYQLAGLRKKYGKNWVAREELFIWKFLIGMTSNDSYNKMGFPLLNRLYKLYILPRIRETFRSPNYDLVDGAYTVLKSYKTLYFFFSYIDKILKVIPRYPVGIFNKVTYKAVYRFFRMYFVFKPYWIHLSKLYELILLYINVNSKVTVYLLDNMHLNASYMARYIMTCLRLKFDYRDTMIPIRRTLFKIMLAKRWRPVRDFKKKGWNTYLKRYRTLLRDRLKFHLINNDIYKMYYYRWRLLFKFKKLFRRPVYRKFKFFNFFSLKKNLNLIKQENLDFFSKKDKIVSILKNVKKVKFFYFNLRKINKVYLKKMKKFMQVLKKLKKKIFLLKFLMSFKWRLYIYLKNSFDIIFSFIDRISNIDKFFTIILEESMSSSFRRFQSKATFWLKRRKRMRWRVNVVSTRRHKIWYGKTRRKKRFDLLPYRTHWRHTKGWSYERTKFFRNLTGKNWVFKEINEEDILEVLIQKTFIINFFEDSEYDEIDCSESHFDIKVYLLDFAKNRLYFYDKHFKRKFIHIFLNLNTLRGYSNLFFFNFARNYSTFFKPFLFNLNFYRKYIKAVLNLPDVESQIVPKTPRKYELEEMPLKDKFRRLRALEGGSRSILYGYKFHFVGRFTRKQKAASLWYAKGANSVSSMRVDVDYGFHTIALRYSACTLKVWLYRNRGFSFKHGYRLV